MLRQCFQMLQKNRRLAAITLLLSTMILVLASVGMRTPVSTDNILIYCVFVFVTLSGLVGQLMALAALARSSNR